MSETKHDIMRVVSLDGKETIYLERDAAEYFTKRNPVPTETTRGWRIAGEMRRPTCPTCGKDISGFRDSLSRREYSISGMCQECQDSVFDADKEE